MGLDEISEQNGIGFDAVEWMKTHTIGDLKNIAAEMDSDGRDAKELWCLINDLMVMEDN